MNCNPVVKSRYAHDGPGVGRVQKGSAISLRFFQDKMASTELNERKRFRSSSDSDVTLSPGSEPRKRKFEVSEEEWLSVLQRVKDLEAKQLTDTKRIENLSTELTASQEENGVLKRELMALQDSLEFSQKEQDEVKGRVEHVEVDAVSNKNRIIKQELYNRRWNLLFFGVKEESGENCKEKVVKIIADKLNIRDASGIRFCGVHRIGRRRMGPQRSRPIICRFTCREDRERVYKAKSKLKNTNIRINDDVPEEVREIRRKVLVPALKKIKAQQQSAKVTIVGDKLLHDGHFYDHNRIPARWLSTYESDED